MFLDGDTPHPTICGTGLEDYVGSAWGMGCHATPYGGCTLDIRPPDATGPLSQPDFVGMYRWHVPDPIMYATELKVTMQQIGGCALSPRPRGRDGRDRGQRASRRPRLATHRRGSSPSASSSGSTTPAPRPTSLPGAPDGGAIDVAGAVADVGRRPYEAPDPMEATGIPLP